MIQLPLLGSMTIIMGLDNARILIVDDDPIVLQTVAKMIKHLGHYATGAKDGFEALRKMAKIVTIS